MCLAFSECKCRAVSLPTYLCVKRYILSIYPIFKTIVSLWIQNSNSKCNDLFAPIVSDSPLEMMNTSILLVELFLGDAKLTEKFPRALHPALNKQRETSTPVWHHIQGKTESSGVLGRPGLRSTEGGAEGWRLKPEPGRLL